MALHSMKLSHLAGTALVLGAVAPQALAQTSAIVPVGQAPGITAPDKAPLGAAVPAPVVAPQGVARPKAEVQVRDMEASEVLDMISRSFDVPIVIAQDVRGIVLPVINLPNTTPEAAIQAITMAAGLKYRKQADGTFLIAKTLADDPEATSAITAPRSKSFGDGSVAPLSPIGELDSEDRNNVFEIPALVGDSKSVARKRRQFIRLRNVAPTIMAYWLDPAHHEMPVQFQASTDSQKRYGPQALAQSAFNGADQLGGQSNSASTPSPFNAGTVNPYTQQRSNAEVRANAQFGGAGQQNNGQNNGNRGGAGGGVFDLPEGVDQIVAIDPQNALLVFGTDEGVRELQDTIAFLDKPLQQVEIEAQFVTVQTSATNTFGINYSTAQGNFSATATGFAPAASASAGALTVGFVRGNFRATLTALLSQNRAKIITAPRILAINNLTASLSSTTSTPVILTTVSQSIGGQQAQGQNLIFINTSIGLTVTPTINNDGTITVLMQPQLSSQTGGVGGVPGVVQQQLQTIANVRDGDTIALGGLKAKSVTRNTDKIPFLSNIPFFGALFRNKVSLETDSDLIIFLTARIQRRVEDNEITPGT